MQPQKPRTTLTQRTLYSFRRSPWHNITRGHLLPHCWGTHCSYRLAYLVYHVFYAIILSRSTPLIMQPLTDSHGVNDYGGFSPTKKIVIQTPIRSPVTFTLISNYLEIIIAILADYI